MNKFCKECGSPISSSLNFCQQCGHQLEQSKQSNQATVPTTERQPRKYSKKQKIIMSAALTLAVILGGFYIWGNSYTSPENTVERFVNALQDEDHAAIRKLTGLANGSPLSETEAKAFILLAKEKSDFVHLNTLNLEEFSSENELFYITKDGKWMGIFDQYSFALKPQYVELFLPFTGVENTLNGKEFPIYKSEDNRIVYGPIAPGIYQLKSSFSGEYTKVDSEEKVFVADTSSDWISHDVELSADYVTLELYNVNGVPIENAFIEINDQKVMFNEDLVIEELGPLELDGSISITPTIETRWGNVESNSVSLEGNYHEIEVNTVSEALVSELSDVILLYGEEYVHANASYDEKVFTSITDEMRKDFQSNFQYYRENDEHFSGQLDSIEINFDKLQFIDGSHASVPAKFYFTSDMHRADEQADVDERIDHSDVEIIFDADTNEWLVNTSHSVDGWYSDEFHATKTIEGSKEFYQASKKASISETEVASAQVSNEEFDSLIEQVTLDYVYQLVEAINSNDYEKVSPYIKNGSALHDMQEDLVERLNDEGMTQEVINASVTSIEEADGKWIVTTDETIKLIYESGKETTNDYTWKYTVEKDGDSVALVDIGD